MEALRLARETNKSPAGRSMLLLSFFPSSATVQLPVVFLRELGFAAIVSSRPSATYALSKRKPARAKVCGRVGKVTNQIVPRIIVSLNDVFKH